MSVLVFDQHVALAGTDDGDSNTSINIRNVIPAALLSAGAGGETQFRVTVLFGTSQPTNSATIIDMYGGRGAPSGNTYAFANAPTHVTFSSGSTNINGAAASTQTSDWVTLPEAFDNTKPFVISFKPSNSIQFNSSIAGITGTRLWTLTSSSDDAATQAATGYADNGVLHAFVTKIEIQSVGTPTFTMAVTETPDTAAFTTTVADKGALAVTEAADTAAFTATFADTLILATTEAVDGAAFTANFADTLALATTETADAAAFTTAFDDEFALSTTEAADIAAFAVGSGTPSFSLATTETADMATFATAFDDEFALATTETPDIAAFTGSFADQGALAVTEIADIASFAASFDDEGALATTESPDIAAFAASFVGLTSGALAVTELPDIAAFSITAPLTDDGQTVLTDRRGAGSFSRKRYEELLEVEAAIAAAQAKARTLRQKAGAELRKGVDAATKVAQKAGILGDIAPSLAPLTEAIDDALSANAAQIAAQARQIAIVAERLMAQMEDDDEDDIMLMIWALQ